MKTVKTVKFSLTTMAAALCLVAAATFNARAQEEVPFITTPDNVTKAMLELAKVGAGDRVVDLGSGDGRIVITAARMGATGLGVEIVPDLVAKSRDNARRAGVADRAEFRQQDLFDTSLEGVTVVTMYLLPELNLKLRPRLLAMPAGTRVVSHDWDMGDWQPDRTVTLDVPDKTIGRDKRSNVHLWVVPARVHGLWCAKGASLRIEQRFQRYSATLELATQPSQPALVQDGSLDPVDGVTLRPASAALPGVMLRAQGDALHVLSVSPTSAASVVLDTRFARSRGAACS